ncbi:hypothetical protein Tco_1493207 [Tanacetum coccineum]
MTEKDLNLSSQLQVASDVTPMGAYEVDGTQSSVVVRDKDARIQKKSNGLVTSEKASKCKLWHLKKSNIVALGTVYKSAGKQMLHNQALPNDCYKVSIDSSIVDAACISANSVNSAEPTLSSKPTNVEVPKELPKVSMVNTSLKKLKHHLDGFDVVVKERTTRTAITEVYECEKCLKLETELQTDFIEKEIYDKLDNSVSNQSAPSFDQLFELNELKAQSQEKDTIIKKLKERIKSLSGKQNEDKIKKDLEEIKTINIELDHRVTKLIAENEHLKQTYKQLYDSIKPARIRSKEQCDDLINQVNLKFVEISDLNASLQEKVLVITSLNDDLSKLKGKALIDNDVTKHPSDPKMLKIDVEPITPKLLNKQRAYSAYIKH